MPDNENRTKQGFGARMAEKTLDRLIGKLDEKDRRAAAERVTELREKHPEADNAGIANLLIKRKCRRAAVVGAVTAVPATIPGLGTLTSLVLGSTVDLALTAGMQAELVLELAACYEVAMTPSEERSTILLVTGLGAGANKLLESAGRRVAAKASERLAEKSVARSLPVIGIGAAAGANMVTTYAIGRRAISYFSLGPDRMEDWSEALRAVSGLDERRLVTWMSEAGESARSLIGDGARSSRDKVITVAKSTGELVMDGASRASDVFGRAVGRVSRLFRKGTETRGEPEPEPNGPAPPLLEAENNSDRRAT